MQQPPASTINTAGRELPAVMSVQPSPASVATGKVFIQEQRSPNLRPKGQANGIATASMHNPQITQTWLGATPTPSAAWTPDVPRTRDARPRALGLVIGWIPLVHLTLLLDDTECALSIFASGLATACRRGHRHGGIHLRSTQSSFVPPCMQP